MSHQKQRLVVEDQLFATVARVSRVYGLAPVHFTGTRSNTVMNVSRSWHIYAIILTIIASIGYIYSTICIVAGTFYSSELPKVLRIVFLLGNCSVTMFMFVCGALYGVKRWRRFLWCFDETQKITKRAGNDYELNTKKWPLYVYISVSLVSIWGLGLLNYWYYYEWNFVICFLYLMYSTVSLLGLQFMIVAMSIHSAFRTVNKSLQEVLTNIQLMGPNSAISEDFLDRTDLQFLVSSSHATVDLTGVSDRLRPDLKAVQEIKTAHKTRQITLSFVAASNVLRKLNSSEGIILFLQFVLFAIGLTITIYNTFSSVHDDEIFLKKYLHKILQIVWISYHVTKIMVLVEPCWWTQVEVSNTRLLVGRIMCYMSSETEHLRDELNDLYKQLMLNNPSYSPAEMCNIDRSLITKIVGSVTTILFLCYEF